MRFRNLSYQELNVLKEDFFNFLYTKRFCRYEWKILQDQSPMQAISLLNQYSESTFQKLMKEVEYLEIRKSKELVLIRCLNSYSIILGIKVPEHSAIDLLDTECLQSIEPVDLGGFKSFQKKQEYQAPKEIEIFQLIEKGAKVTDSQVFDTVNLLRQGYQN